MNRHGILILAHGTPAAEGTRAFLEFARLVAGMVGETPVATGFMEFASPTIAEGLAVLAEKGVARVAAVPVFLSAAGHTANDIPKDVAEAQEQFSEIQVSLTPHVGSHVKVAELSALRYKEALAGRADVLADNTLNVIAAHGSPEAEAFEELQEFARARQKLTSEVRIIPCFSQMGSPLLKDVLPELARSWSAKPSPPAPVPKGKGPRIIVQPHFLLKGRLVDAIVKTTDAVAKQYPEIDFVVTEPLGCHRLLAEAVLELGSMGG